MKLILPYSELETGFIDASSSVLEDDADQWVDGTMYSVGSEIIRNHTVFECVIANNNQDPELNTADSNGISYWLNIGSTNRYKMFDSIIQNQTTSTADISFDLSPTRIVNSIALLNVFGNSVSITARDSSNNVFYNKTISLINTDRIYDAYTYCFSEAEYTPDIVVLDIPPYLNATYSISVTTSSSEARIGEVVCGSSFDVGESLVGATPGIESFSVIETDGFGRTSVVPRANRKLLTIDTAIETARIDAVTRKMADVIDKPVVWIGSEQNSSLIVYGILGNFSPPFGTPNGISFINFEIKGIT